MPLPAEFTFSQHSLQDFADCPRRFYLRYIRRLAWPAIQSEPVLENERMVEQGAAFHRLLHQHAIGIPVEQLEATSAGAELEQWWTNYREWGPTDLPVTRYPEIVLTAPLAGYRLLARYDLIAVEAGQRAVIVDWKTSQRRPDKRWLAKRFQTRVYAYLFVRAGSHLNGGKRPEPEQVTMLYWFANAPTEPEELVYDVNQYQDDEKVLCQMIQTIAQLNPADFGLTLDEKRCRFCRYRSLCDRGLDAAWTDQDLADEWEPQADELLTLDMDQIGEIEY